MPKLQKRASKTGSCLGCSHLAFVYLLVYAANLMTLTERGSFLLVDDIGLDLHLCHWAKIKVWPPAGRGPAAVHRTAASEWVRAHPGKRKAAPEGAAYFLVDDIGLEPMTFRTSSGCSSQLS